MRIVSGLTAFLVLVATLVFVATLGDAAEEKPLPRFAPEKADAAHREASLIFEGKILEADLTPGIHPGYLGVCCKRVAYEVTDPVKGSFKKQVETWFMLIGDEVGGDYMDPAAKAGEAPRLDPKLFAKWSTHLLFCVNQKDAGPKWKDWFKMIYGDQMGKTSTVVVLVTPEVKDAKAKAKAKVEAGGK